MSKKLATGMCEEALKLDKITGPLCKELCDWIFKSWYWLCNKDMMKSGWERIGLLNAWKSKMQLIVVKRNLKEPSFDTTVPYPKEKAQFTKDNNEYNSDVAFFGQEDKEEVDKRTWEEFAQGLHSPDSMEVVAMILNLGIISTPTMIEEIGRVLTEYDGPIAHVPAIGLQEFLNDQFLHSRFS